MNNIFGLNVTKGEESEEIDGTVFATDRISDEFSDK